MPALRVRLLGPVDVLVDGAPRALHGQRRKAVLAVLALHPGEVVSTGRLVDLVWGDTAPPNVVNALQSHVSYLRRMLEDKAAILSRPPGYLLDVGADGTDVAVAERLVEAGLSSDDDATRARRLQAALELWRGAPLADTGGPLWLEEQATRLGQLWLRAKRGLLQARLGLGEHSQMLPDLEDLTRRHPFDEELHGQLMQVLYRSGRQADALAVFRRLRRTLHDDLGIEPGQALRELEAAVLRQDRSLEPAPEQPVRTDQMRKGPEVYGTVAAGTPAAQLPLAVRAFAGRAEELAELDTLLLEDRAVGVAVVTGTAGVGKSALVVHWAHRAAARFPDGQLYVNLRGFDPADRPVEPADAVRGFLDALGVAGDRVPADLAAQAALLRSLLAGRRMLLVLDNARDAEQVRPLLPGSPGCLAVVTSRDALTSLVVIESALPVSVELLTGGEAQELLTKRLGAARVEAEPAAAADIVARCARLPLALAVAAGRAAARPDLPLSAVAAQLDAAAGGSTLDAITGDDPVSDPRAVFSWSYRALRPAAAELLRRLSLAAGPDLGIDAVASICGAPVESARAPLAELIRANLVVEQQPGRYTFHDLLRAYAAEQAKVHDAAPGYRLAVHRLLDHYLHGARGAARLLDPADDLDAEPATGKGAGPAADSGAGKGAGQSADSADDQDADQDADSTASQDADSADDQDADQHADSVASQDADLVDDQGAGQGAGQGADLVADSAGGLGRLAEPLPGTVVPRHGSREEALAWFAREERALLAAVRLSADAGFDRHTWQLTAAMTTFLDRRGRWHDLAAAQEAALRALRKAGEHPAGAPRAEGLGSAEDDAACALGRTYARTGRFAEAEQQFGVAMRGYAHSGDEPGLARASYDRGWLAHAQGRYDEALALCEQALRLFDRLGDRLWRGRALNATGWIRGRLGAYGQALQRCREALTEAIEFGDRHGEAAVWDAVGHAHHHLGDPRHAIACYGHALTAYRELGDRAGEACVLVHLGDAHADAGEATAAAEAWQRGLRILDELDPVQAAAVRTGRDRALSASSSAG